MNTISVIVLKKYYFPLNVRVAYNKGENKNHLTIIWFFEKLSRYAAKYLLIFNTRLNFILDNTIYNTVPLLRCTRFSTYV